LRHRRRSGRSGQGHHARRRRLVRAGVDHRLPARPRSVPRDLRLMIRIRGLSKQLGKKQVLDGLDLEIPTGETWVIIGRSGTGKSVLLKHIVGLMRPDAGSIEIDGDDISTMDEAEISEVRKR